MSLSVRLTSLGVALGGISAAYANGVDIIGYGGFSQVQGFSNDILSEYVGTMTGYDMGASVLFTLFSTPFAPVLGAGVNYLSVTNSATVTGESSDSAFSSTSAVIHAGMSLNVPFFELILVGNYGIPVSDSFDLKVKGITAYNGVSDHTIYGVTGLMAVKVAPFIAFGLGGTYNIHNLTVDGVKSVGTSNISGQSINEVSVNGAIIIDL
jgi:hypothetical protein